MRIAVWHNLPSGGGKRALYNHVQGLVARGHHVEAWCPPTADQTYLPLSDLIVEHVVDLEWPVRHRRTDYWQLTLQTERSLAAMAAHCQTCAEAIDSGGFDILFANSCKFFRTPPIGRQARTPAVLYLQEPYRWLFEALPRLPWLAAPRSTRPWWSIKRWRVAFTDRREIQNVRVQARDEVDNAAAYARILVNSYFSRESVLRAYGLDSVVCYLGIDVEQFPFQDGQREDLIVSLGSITPEKNVRFCIDAIGTLPAPRPKLVWVGNIANPQYQTDMIRLANDRQVELEMRVRVSDAELQEILGRAMVMVYAPRLEPFGLAPLEANACGVPVVAVAEGGVRETVVDGVTGLLVENNPAAMGVAIQRLRSDPALARRLGEHGKQIVDKKWSIESATIRLEAELLHYSAEHT